MRWAVALVLLALAAPARAQEAYDGPTDGELVAGGLAMALPMYMLGVAVHEGTHAVAAELVGADTTDIHLWPGRNPYNGHFQFGWTRVRGLGGTGERIFFLAAPKIPDALLLGGYALLYAYDGLPESRWWHLTVQVLATGFWIDFAKDVLVFHDGNDIVRVFSYLGLDDEWERLPARIAYAAVSVAAGYVVWLGWEDLFTKDNGATSSPLREPSGERVISAPVLSVSF
jgi:hypothetical protein